MNLKNALIGVGSALVLAGAVAVGALVGNGARTETVYVPQLVQPFGVFDGAPTSPQPISQHPDYANFDVQMYDGDPVRWYTPGPLDAQHGPACQGPASTTDGGNALNTHPATAYNDMVFICANHVMTSFNAGNGYGEIMLTKNQLLDWTNGEASVRFDVSTMQMSDRDWIDIHIAPFLDNVATPFDETGAFNNFAKNGFWIKQLGGFGCHRIVNYQKTVIDDRLFFEGFSTGIAPGTNLAAVRQNFKITITRTHLRVERLQSSTADAKLYCDVDIPDTLSTQGFSSGVVQLGQHSYNPTKGNQRGPNNEVLGTGLPASWHWDEINYTCSGGPCQAINLIKAGERIVPSSPGGPGTYDVHMAVPAPANAYFRFSAVGVVELSYNNGSTYHAARETSDVNVPVHVAHSYIDPVPAGTQNVKVRLSGGGNSGNLNARDFSFMSIGGAPAPTPTPPPVATATNTATSVATSTRTPTPVSTVVPATPTVVLASPTVVPSPTVVSSTPTSVPTQVATPTPATCTEYQSIDNNQTLVRQPACD